MIDLVHHIMYRYEKITETDLKENQNKFYEALDNTMPIDKYFELINDWIQYEDDGKQTYTAAHIINNYYNMVLATGLYI